MADPFLVTGPALISFSGGRTSAYMLWRILQAHGGTLPADVLVAFENTGKAASGGALSRAQAAYAAVYKGKLR